MVRYVINNKNTYNLHKWRSNAVPRKKEPSFELKMLIWDKAATIGKKPEVILRELDIELERLREEDKFHEDTPDVRTIKRIIERDINQLDQEVVIAKLPRHAWHLRDDYEAVKILAETTAKKSALPKDQATILPKDQATIALVIASNLEKIHSAPPESLGDPFGHTVYKVKEKVYGGWWVYEDRARLGDVDRTIAAALLKRLKEEEEFPELADIEDWKELKEAVVTEDFIQRLISRAHRGSHGTS